MVFVARRWVFRERELIFKEESGSAIDLEEIQDSYNEGTSNNTSTQHEKKVPIELVDNSLPLFRSSRASMAPTFNGLHIMSDGDTFISDRTLVNLDETTNYKEAMIGPETAKWKEVMDSEI